MRLPFRREQVKEELTQRWKAGVLGPSQLDLDAMKPEHRAEEEQPYDLVKREYGQHANQGEERSGPYFYTTNIH